MRAVGIQCAGGSMPGIVSYGAYVPVLAAVSARPSAPRWAAAAAGARRSVASLRRGHHVARRRGGPHRPARRAGRGGRRTTCGFCHDRARLPRQDERHRDPRRARPCRRRCRRVRRRRVRCARTSAAPAPGRQPAGGLAVLSRRPHRPARAAPTRPTAATPRRRSLFGDGPDVIAEPIGGGHGDRRVPRPLAHARRRALRASGRSASASTPTCRWPRRPSPTR